MEGNRIYFRDGFKSYDITIWTSDNVVWFDWVERSRNMMRRVTLNKNGMDMSVLKEASTDQKNLMRRWRNEDQAAR